MWTTSVQKTVISKDGEVLYTFTARGETEEVAMLLVRIYASMVEFGLTAEKWMPADLPFPEEQLLQFIQPSQLDLLKNMYPDVVTVAYQNAYAYVQSYIGAMFDVDAMLDSGDTSASAMTLRLALAICTVTFILASSPQYSDVIELHNKQLHMLLRGLKSGNRNFSKNAITGEPNVRASVVSLTRIGNTP